MPGLPTYTTRFGSLADYQKGEIDLIDDDPKRYAFSNIFEVAEHSKPYEKVAVGKNRQYVLEAIRAEGTSGWRTAPHDEFALVMDGEVEIRLRKLGEGDPGPRAGMRGECGDVTAGEEHAPAVGAETPGEDVQSRGLPGAVGSDDADRLVLGHAERQTVEHQKRAEGPRDPVERQ